MVYHILIADDIPVNRKMIKGILMKNMEGMIFFEAEDGITALEILESQSIDLVILDLLMPGKNGYQVLQEMKSKENMKEIPVIINSAIDDISSIKKTLEMGALDYFTFPLKPEDMSIKLPLKIKNALNYYEHRKSLMEINEKNNKELMIANAFQTSLMSGTKQFDMAHMYGKFIPCSMVGGDMYDCIEDNGSLWFIIADVAGHGLVSSMISTMLKGIFNNIVHSFSNPHEVLESINTIFYSILGEFDFYLVSAFVGVIREGKLFYSNAGHPYPMIINKSSGKIELLEQNGCLLVMMKETNYETRQIDFGRDNAILLYSDGLFNLKSGDLAGYWERLQQYTHQSMEMIRLDPQGYLDHLIGLFHRHQGIEFEDDVSVMMIDMK